MNEKVITIIVIIALIATGGGVFILLSGATSDGKLPNAGEIVIDAVGREVVIPDNLDGGIVTVGSSGPLRFLSIFDMFDDVIQVDKGDVTDNKNGRAYSYAYPYDTFTADQYHPDSQLDGPTMERIAAKQPSLIIVQYSVYTNFKDNCDLLGEHFTLAVIPAQQMVGLWDENYTLSDWYVETVELIGDLVGKPQRAVQHLSAVNGIIADIRSYVGTATNISTYVAGLTISGSNELTTTFPSYMPLMLVDGINAHGGTQTGRVNMETEAVALLDIDMVVIDPSSSDKLSTVDSQAILEMIYTRNTDLNNSNDIALYITLPMVWDSANYDCVLAGAYYMAHLLYGTLTISEVEAKVVQVFEAFYGDDGTGVFNSMKLFFQGKSGAHGQQMPLLRQVQVALSGSTYSIVAA